MILIAVLGDKVACFLGAKLPYVVRPTTHGVFVPIGSAFVPELAAAEAFLGPLSPVWTQFHDQHGYNQLRRWYFRDTETGEIFLNDPRLGPLPVGWEEVPIDLTGDRRWHNSTTSKVNYCDPRLFPENLRNRGVALEEIVIGSPSTKQNSSR